MKVIRLHKKESFNLNKLRRQDRREQKRLYERYAPKMLSVARMYIKDLQFAEDSMLRAFVKVFSKINQFDDQGSLEGWIRRIVVREAIDFLRKKQNLVYEETLENLSQQACEQPSLDRQQIANDLQQALDLLPAGYRSVFVLFEVEDFSHKQIAECCNISVGTSKSQLAKAKRMLQDIIKNSNSWKDGSMG
ncbi:RNA polymerase sigma factor [Mesonia sediminis]|uniref:RNA polymerase sigma factor n=1 Tax=Mesonia sediminis TaxID=1703946 RepID=A0ABW5SGK1_9FLAO